MSQAFLILSSAQLRRALESRLSKCYGWSVYSHPAPIDNPRGLPPRETREWICDAFCEIANFLDRHAGESGTGLHRALAVIDLYDPDCFNMEQVCPLEESISPRSTLVAMLLLAYPEIQWVLFTPYGFPEKVLFADAHRLSPEDGIEGAIAVWSTGHTPLFDASGIRDFIRSSVWPRVWGSTADSEKGGVPNRRQIAVAIDEEEAYAYFEGLVAFRCGYRVAVITSWRALRAGLRGGETRSSDPGHPVSPAVTFEDVYLNFPDRPESFQQEAKTADLGPDEHQLSYLRFRDRKSANLEPTEQRVLITVGHQRGQLRRKIWLKNRLYLGQKAYGHRWILKPVSGLFRVLRDGGFWTGGSDHLRPAQGYTWPIAAEGTQCATRPTHSAPGRLLLIAERLLRRGRRILNSCGTVPDAVHAAVLAIEAKELLGCATPTTALEAVALQHEAEVIAESLFMGVEYNLDLNDRFKEIEREVRAISSWFHEARRKQSVRNAQLTIIERLASRFRELHQVEEEMACLARARSLRFEFWAGESPWRWPLWQFVLRPLAFGLSSVSRFLALVAIVICGFAFLYWGAAALAGRPDLARPLPSLAGSAYFTFTLQPPECWANIFASGSDAAWCWHLLMGIHGAISFANLGLLLSHLYMIVSRR